MNFLKYFWFIIIAKASQKVSIRLNIFSKELNENVYDDYNSEPFT